MARRSSYAVLAAGLREAVLRGDYTGGARLPTEAQLAADHDLSRQTVRRAMQDLVSEGLVYRVPGRGTYAVDASERYLRQFGSVEDLMSLSLDTECVIVERLHRVDDPDAADALELGGDETAVDRVSFVRRHSGTVFCHTVVSLPPDVGAGLRAEPALARRGRRSAVTVIGLLDTHLETPIRDAEQTLLAVACPRAVAAELGVRAGSAVLRVERTYRDGTARPVEFAVSHFNPELYAYRVRLRRHPR